MMHVESKSEMRARMREALGRISPAVRAVESIDLCARLKTQMQSAHTVLFFAPMPDELDVWPLLAEQLKEGKVIALPYFDAEANVYSARRVLDVEMDIGNGKFGVREPLSECEEVPFKQFDLVLVPGMAFDAHGNRLGRGRGFYDRMLAEASGIKCGVGYDFQLMESVPTEAHDARVNFILTPTRFVRRRE